MKATSAESYRTLSKSQTYAEFPCRDCGRPVVWAISKKGNTYLASRVYWRSDAGASNGRSNEKSFYPFHECEPDEEYRSQYAAAMTVLDERRAAAVEAGEIVRGQTIEVVKGKKIPVGTRGVVFWVATEPDRYGVIKAGFNTETGEKFFTNVSNLAVAR